MKWNDKKILALSGERVKIKKKLIDNYFI